MEKANLTGRGILIVEDNDINREMLKEILGEKYRILEAADGVEGMELLKKHYKTLSLVLLDVQMPRMDGYEFLKIYSNDSVLAGIPVIVTTGSTVTEDEERCLSLGAADFITKPYKPKIILRRVEALIRLRESIAALQAVELDPLTGLYTRNAFRHHAQNYLNFSEGDGFDMLMINVEDFSYVSERFGEHMSSELLKHIGRCITALCPQAFAASRYSTDRFILLRRHIASDHASESEDFDRQLHENAPLPDFTVKYAVYESVPEKTPINVLINRLALAMDAIKHQYNRQIICYDDKMSERVTRLRKVEECMSEALREGQFKIYYQPKHDAHTGRIAGAEALVRWTHPELGFISPGDFIPLFEENGFITDLDLYVWQSVCRDLRKWQDAGIPLVPISVNASRRDFVAIDRADMVLQPVTEYRIDKSFLHIEITESLAIHDNAVVEKVKTLRDMGFKIELDDFGAGYSSLGTLQNIPMDIIKLDASFARNIQRQEKIVRMMIALSHELGHETVAEGVEDAQQLRLLQELDCDLIQGYYFSGPLPEDRFMEYLMTKEGAKL